MTRDEQCKLLEDNGWKIVSKFPFEIEKHEDTKLVAKAFGQAAFTIAYHLEHDNKLPKELSLEKVKSFDGLTVGQLKELLYQYNLPSNGKVLVQRVHDSYFERGWEAVYKKGYSYYMVENTNKDIANGEYDNNVKPISEENIKMFLEQYHPAWCASKFDDDNENLYIGMFY